MDDGRPRRYVLVWSAQPGLGLRRVVLCRQLRRWIGRKLQRGAEGNFPLVAALVSGAVFAAVHLHAATFVPLWFLGVAFAWLYWRTGSILAPMFAHFLFNATNLALILAGVVD